MHWRPPAEPFPDTSMNYRLCDDLGGPYRTAGDDAKVLFCNGLSYRYALVTTYYTYPEPTPATLPEAVILLSGVRMNWRAWMVMLPPAPCKALAMMSLLSSTIKGELTRIFPPLPFPPWMEVVTV